MSQRLEKQLNELKAKQKQELQQQPVLEEVQKLLAYDTAEDRRILRDMGIDASLVQGEQIHNKIVQLEKFDEKYGQVFHIDSIKELCMNYRLRFLNSDRYRGKIDVELTSKIKEFAKANDIELRGTTLQYKFYVMAPGEMFDIKNYKVPKTPPDPMLFYKIDDDHYRLIHRWGNDFSPIRAIKGWMWRSEGNYMLFCLLAALACAALFASLVTGLGAYTSNWRYALQVPVSVILWIIFYTRNTDEGDFMKSNLTEENWNSDQRRRS